MPKVKSPSPTLQEFAELCSIREYKQKIQGYIWNQIKEEGQTPTAHAVLKYLLQEYKSSFFGLNFFTSFNLVHTKFSKQLIQSLENKDFNLLVELEIFLQKNKLNMKSGLFALFIAYFNYYKIFYSNLSDYQEIKKQVIIPLNIHNNKIQKNIIIRLLSELESPYPDIHLSACQALGDISISQEMQERVINSLIEQIKIEDQTIEINGYYYPKTYSFSQSALRSLGKLPVSKELQIVIIDIVLESFDNSCSNGRKNIIEFLGNITIPLECTKKIEEFLLDIAIKGNDGQIDTIEEREASWKLLDKLNLGTNERYKWLEKQIKKKNLKYRLADVLPKISPFTIPLNLSKELIPVLLQFLENCGSSYYQHNTREEVIDLLWRKVFIPKELNRRVISSLLIEVKRYSHAALFKLSEMDIPDDMIDQVMSVLIGLLQDDASYNFWSSLYLCFSEISTPSIYHESILTLLLKRIDDNQINDTMFRVFVNINFSEDKLEGILNKLLTLLKDKEVDQLTKNTIGEAIERISISDNELREKLITELLAIIPQGRSDDFNTLRFLMLGKIARTENDAKIITDALLVRLSNKPSDALVQDILETICSLQKHNCVDEVVTVHARINHIKPSFSHLNKINNLKFDEQYKNIAYSKAILEKALPRELCQNIAKFM